MRLGLLAPVPVAVLLMGCRVDTAVIEGVTYVKVQAGLGIVNKSVPNALEAEFPAMHIRVVSPVLEQAAHAVLLAYSGVLGWIIEGVKRGLAYLGWAAGHSPDPLFYATAKREPDEVLDHRHCAIPP